MPFLFLFLSPEPKYRIIIVIIISQALPGVKQSICVSLLFLSLSLILSFSLSLSFWDLLSLSIFPRNVRSLPLSHFSSKLSPVQRTATNPRTGSYRPVKLDDFPARLQLEIWSFLEALVPLALDSSSCAHRLSARNESSLESVLSRISGDFDWFVALAFFFAVPIGLLFVGFFYFDRYFIIWI